MALNYGPTIVTDGLVLALDSMEELMKVNKTTRVVSAERNMCIEL